METLVIQSKNKATSNRVKKILKELKGVESVSFLPLNFIDTFIFFIKIVIL